MMKNFAALAIAGVASAQQMLVSDSVVKTAYGTMVQTTDLGDRIVKNIKVPTIPYIQNYSV